MVDSEQVHGPGARASGRTVYRLLAVGLVLLLPDLIRFGVPLWYREYGADAAVLSLLFAGALWAASAGTSMLTRIGAGAAVLVAGAGAVFVLTTVAPAVQWSRSITMLSLAVSAVLLVGSEARSAPVRGLVLAAVGAAGLAAAVWAPHAGPDGLTARSRPAFTTYHTVQITNQGRVIDAEDVHVGGGFTRLDDHLIVVSGSSALYELTWDSDRQSVSGRRLPIEPPMDLSAFDPAITTRPGEAIRAQHVIGRRVDDGWQLFVSHHVWTDSNRCVNMAISSAVLSPALDRVVDDWTRLATMQPCLSAEKNHLGEGFQGLFSGGRMAWLSADDLLVTTGDHGFDMVGRMVPVSQLDDYDYGKTRVIDVRTGAIRPYTKGNRNPQGLYIDPSGRVWSTEQGPRGGDELNLLEPGGNYGWPFATLGTDYSLLTWPPVDTAVPDASYIEPRYAWLPSVGLTSVIGIEGDRFPRWTGNLMASSLAARTLYRIGLDGDHVQFVEPIPIGVRVRDVVETPSGDLWLWDDLGEVLTITPAPASARGAAAFAACVGCHTTEPGAPGGIGPNLAGVVNRLVASDESYPSYSVALQGLGGRWTPERLDTFLSDPAAFAPGTTMTYRVPGAEDREALIDHLMSPD